MPFAPLAPAPTPSSGLCVSTCGGTPFSCVCARLLSQLQLILLHCCIFSLSLFLIYYLVPIISFIYYLIIDITLPLITYYLSTLSTTLPICSAVSAATDASPMLMLLALLLSFTFYLLPLSHCITHHQTIFYT